MKQILKTQKLLCSGFLQAPDLNSENFKTSQKNDQKILLWKNFISFMLDCFKNTFYCVFYVM